MKRGGLEIKDTRAMNQAFLAKAEQRLLQHNRDALWAQVCKEKYIRRFNLNEAPRHLQRMDSTTWRGICHGINLLNKGIKQNIRIRD